MSQKVVVRSFPRFSGPCPVREITLNDDVLLAEDIVIQLTQEMGISAISLHLFALFHKQTNVWLPPNQNIGQWISHKKNNQLELELRIRFKPSNLKLLVRDQNAFDYYFFQIRSDFRRTRSEKIDLPTRIPLLITDFVAAQLEHECSLSPSDEKLRDEFFTFSNITTTEWIKMSVISKKAIEVVENIRIAWKNTKHDSNIPKMEYVALILGTSTSGSSKSPDRNALLPDYHMEAYKAKMVSRGLDAVIVRFQPRTQELEIKSMNSGNWQQMCCIEDLCSIGVKESVREIELYRKNGVPEWLSFSSLAELRSFVSLLDGYYRLSQKWSFSLCKDISSPLLLRLKSWKCHGPVERTFAEKKLMEKAGTTCGAYILRQSEENVFNYFLDVVVDPQTISSFQISSSKSCFKCDPFGEYDTLSDLLSHITFKNIKNETSGLTLCIQPSEYDKSSRILLCRLNSDVEKENSPKTGSYARVFASTEFAPTNMKLNQNRYSISVCQLEGSHVVVKGVDIEHQKPSEADVISFLRTSHDWVQLRGECLVHVRGVILYPLAIVMDHYPLGPLDEFLVKNQRELKPVDLIEAASYCALALWYLEEKNLIHGSIRCHNLLVSEYSSSSLKVKLSDPFSKTYESNSLWMAPEARETDCLTRSSDVWAFGTTLWEIFNYGKKADPAITDVRNLMQPFGCPSEVWDLVSDCWNPSPTERKPPHTIFRDINQILYEVYNSRRTNYYSVLGETKAEQLEKYKFERSLGSMSNLSLRSSIRSTSTLLTGLNSSHSDLISLYSNDIIATPSDANWIIEANQLSLESGKLLGQGCYGEVVKAVLFSWCGSQIDVAVKRINQSLPTDSGLKDMMREIDIMKKLNHRNIVEIKGFVEDPHLMIVMEYIQLGSLVSYLKVNKNRMLEKGSRIPLKTFSLDIIDGMKYLESKKIIHRDLAARNILVASESHVKISDFGLAQVINHSDCYRMKTPRGLPLRWYAPESIQIEGTFTHKSDVWSFGVTLWEMYSYGKDPVYPECPDEKMLLQKLQEGKRLECPENCPLEMYEIMRSCWKYSPNERPSFTHLENEIKATSD